MRNGFLSLWALSGLVATFQAAAAADTASPSVSFELNKLEPHDKGCRAYIVVDNPTAAAYQSFKLDLIFFRTDGIIDGEVLFDLAPLRAHKRSVKGLDLEHLSCDAIGTILVNDVSECKTDSGEAGDCLGTLTVSSRASAKMTK